MLLFRDDHSHLDSTQCNGEHRESTLCGKFCLRTKTISGNSVFYHGLFSYIKSRWVAAESTMLSAAFLFTLFLL